ncbi:hypothetical protein ACP4OV_013432 [Aristida adscensionis]
MRKGHDRQRGRRRRDGDPGGQREQPRHALLAVVQVIADLNLVIRKAYFSSDGNWFMDVFNVTDRDGNKVLDDETVSYIQKTLEADDWYYPEARSNTVGIVPSEEYTTIELTGTDRPGLLSEFCAVLAGMRCEVRSTELWTHNTRVAAVVHVADAASGGAIGNADISARLGNLLRGQSDVRVGGAAAAASLTYRPNPLTRPSYSTQQQYSHFTPFLSSFTSEKNSLIDPVCSSK